MTVDINGLRQNRAKLHKEMVALTDAIEAEDRAMTDDEAERFEALDEQITGLDKRIKAAERAQALRGATAIPVRDPDSIKAVERPEAMEPGIGFARMARALIVGKGDTTKAHAFAASMWGEGHPVTTGISAAMQVNDATSGGVFVPERLSAEIIDLLRPMTVVRRRSRTMPLVGGTDTMPTVTSGTAAYYIGEGADIETTEPEFGSIELKEREIAAMVPISNKLLRNASIAVDAWVRDELVRSFAQTEDSAFMRGQGLGAGPKGIRYMAGFTVAANATVNLTHIEADARKLELSLMQAHIPVFDWSWIMSSRVFVYLRDLRDGNANLVFPGLSAASPTWRGYSVEVTEQVPSNLGAGTESELYLVAWPYSVVADSYNVRIDASDTASYRSGGNLVSAYSRNQTVIRALAGHDYRLTRPLAAAVLTAVTWGA
jgi:HK97 family phage major capsid protein